MPSHHHEPSCFFIVNLPEDEFNLLTPCFVSAKSDRAERYTNNLKSGGLGSDSVWIQWPAVMSDDEMSAQRLMFVFVVC